MTNENFLNENYIYILYQKGPDGRTTPAPTCAACACKKSQLQIATIKMRLIKDDSKSWPALRLVLQMLQGSSSGESEVDAQVKVQKSECRMRQDVEGCTAFNGSTLWVCQCVKVYIYMYIYKYICYVACVLNIYVFGCESANECAPQRLLIHFLHRKWWKQMKNNDW